MISLIDSLFNFDTSEQPVILDQKNKVIIAIYATGLNKKDIKVELHPLEGIDMMVVKGTTKNKVLQKEFSIEELFLLDKNKFALDSIKLYYQGGIIYIVINKK